MKKRKLFLLLFLTVLCTINMKHIYAEEGKDILKSVALYTQTGNYEVGDKMTFNIDSTEELSSMKITFRNPVSKDGHYYGSFTVDLTGNCTSVDKDSKCTFNGKIPEKINGYYGTQENDHIEMTIYGGTYEVDSIFVYDKKGNLTRYTTNKDLADTSEFLYYPDKIGVNIKGEIQKDGPDILKNIALYTQTSNYYLGDKMIFNVDTTDEIYSMNITFFATTMHDGARDSFTVYATANGQQNGTTKTLTGYIPKTIAGYYSTMENGRTEMTIGEGTYEVNSIFLYDKNGNIIRYTTNKNFADTSEFLYYEPIIAVNLKEPTADELNDVSFTFNKLNIKGKSSTIGGKVPVDVKYSYNDSNKKIKSIYLIFRDTSKKKTFTTYVKSLTSNPYFIVASSADKATYKLDSVGVTFEATDGTNNTIIFNATSNSGKYSDIFNQELKITGESSSKEEKLYFSADELNDEIYKKIQDSKEDSIIIDADSHTMIPLQLFDIIKNSKKDLIIRHNNIEWVFSGKDIKTPKDIDVLMNFQEVSESNISNNLKKTIRGEAVVLEFPNNGELPGNVLIRIKDKEIIDRLTGDKFYIYYADTENDKLNKVALEVQKTKEGYIEFYINHNSKYVISSEEIKDESVLGKDDPLLKKNTTVIEENVRKRSNPILLYSLIIIVCTASVAIMAVRKTKKIDK